MPSLSVGKNSVLWVLKASEDVPTPASLHTLLEDIIHPEGILSLQGINYSFVLLQPP